MYCEFTMGPLSFREFTRNSRFVLPIHDRYIILFAISVFFWQNHCNSLFLSCNSPYFLLNVISEFTMDQLSFSRILNVSRKYYEFTICFANLLWIYYESVIFSRIHYDFTICFANSLSINDQFRKKSWFHNLFREFTINRLFLLTI